MSSELKNVRQLTLLGILLQSLHILFGVTAIIGVLITQTRISSAQGTIYHSHLQWQFVTFWIGLAGYAVGVYFWSTQSVQWIFPVVLSFIIYRLTISAIAWKQHRAITRWF